MCEVSCIDLFDSDSWVPVFICQRLQISIEACLHIVLCNVPSKHVHLRVNAHTLHIVVDKCNWIAIFVLCTHHLM